jgi:hypothetical protein
MSADSGLKRSDRWEAEAVGLFERLRTVARRHFVPAWWIE